nr:hypothetical protein [Chloroflexota bacterium]
MSKDFLVTLTHGSERDREWMEVFGTDTLAVLSPIPHWAHLPGFDSPQLVYMLDLAETTEEQRARMTAFAAAKFGVPLDEARELLRAGHGVPVLADGCQARILHPQKW